MIENDRLILDCQFYKDAAMQQLAKAIFCTSFNSALVARTKIGTAIELAFVARLSRDSDMLVRQGRIGVEQDMRNQPPSLLCKDPEGISCVT